MDYQHRTPTFDCPECGNTLAQDTPYCDECGWEYQSDAEQKLERLADEQSFVGGRLYNVMIGDELAGALKRDPRVNIFMVADSDVTGNMELWFQIDTTEMPGCPECGAIMDFSGECANGHRAREIQDLWETEAASMLDDEILHHYDQDDTWGLKKKILADDIAQRFKTQIEYEGNDD